LNRRSVGAAEQIRHHEADDGLSRIRRTEPNLFGAGELEPSEQAKGEQTLGSRTNALSRHQTLETSRIRRKEELRQQEKYRRELDEQIRSNRRLRALEHQKDKHGSVEVGIFGIAGRRIVSPTWKEKEPQQTEPQQTELSGLTSRPKIRALSSTEKRDSDSMASVCVSGGKKPNGAYICGMWFEQTDEEIAAKEKKKRKLKRDLERQMLEKEGQRRTEEEESLNWEKKFGFRSDKLPWLDDNNPDTNTPNGDEERTGESPKAKEKNRSSVPDSDLQGNCVEQENQHSQVLSWMEYEPHNSLLWSRILMMK
jgi:hypothetical protein